MSTTLRKVASTVGGIIVVIGLIAFKVHHRMSNDEALKTEERQLYQLKYLNNALSCNTIHHELLEYMSNAVPTLRKGGSVPIPGLFHSGDCGSPGDYRGKIPELDTAMAAYVRNYKEVTSNIDTDHDRKMSPAEFNVLIDNISALNEKKEALSAVYSQVEEKWYRARLETIGDDSDRLHVHWVYTLALDINLISHALNSDTVDVPAVEKAMANLQQNLTEMKKDMDDSDWSQKDAIAQWAADIPSFLKAAETRLDFVKTKLATATDKAKEASIDEFSEHDILDQPDHFKDTFIVPES